MLRAPCSLPVLRRSGSCYHEGREEHEGKKYAFAHEAQRTKTIFVNFARFVVRPSASHAVISDFCYTAETQGTKRITA
jgi:hypothetical protein